MDQSEEFLEEDVFERELEAALRRCDPPEGFAERVLAQAYPRTALAARKPRRADVGARWQLWLAFAACLLFALLGFIAEQHYARELRRQEARAKFELSMAITRQTLAVVDRETRKQLRAAGVELEP